MGSALSGRTLLLAGCASVLINAYAGQKANADTVNPVQTTTYNLTPTDNPITFGKGTDLTLGLPKGWSVYGASGTDWSVTNDGQLLSGIELESRSTLENNGTVQSAFDAVNLADGGTLINNKSGNISAAFGPAVANHSGNINLTNYGLIGGFTNAGNDFPPSIGIEASGFILNKSGGTIEGDTAVILIGNSSSISNAGTITTVLPLGNGPFNTYDAIDLDGGRVVNTGTISGAANGVSAASGTVTNEAGGVISGYHGVYGGGAFDQPGTGPVTVTNAGLIEGTVGSVDFTGPGANSLILQTGSTLVGDAYGSQAAGATTSLVLQGTGTASNNFINFTSLTMQGLGAWTLAGNSTFQTVDITGGTLIVSGALVGAVSIQGGSQLQVATGGSVTGNIALSPDGDVINITGGAIAGNISGNSATNGLNAGTVNFNLGAGGSFTTAGAIDVANININSGVVTLANDVTVAGALTNNATLNLAVIGVRNINGAYAQGANGTLMLAVSPTAATELKISGAASLAGTLDLVFAPGTYTGQNYMLITYKSVTGSFSNIAASNAPAGFTPKDVSVGPTETTLTLLPFVTPRDSEIFSDAAFVFAEASEDAAEALLGRGLPGASAAPSYDLGGGAHGWMNVIGSVLDPAHFRATTGGLEGGGDVDLGSGLRLGAGLAYEASQLSDADGGDANQALARVSLYGSQLLGPVGLSASIAYAAATERFDRAPGFGQTTSSRGADDITGAVQIAAPILRGGTSVTPSAGLVISDLSAGAFTETAAPNAAFALSGASAGDLAVSPYTSVTVAHAFTTVGGMAVTPNLELGYRYDALAGGLSQTLTAADGTPFFGNRASLERSSALVGLGLSAHKGGVTGFISYRADVASNWNNQALAAGLRATF